MIQQNIQNFNKEIEKGIKDAIYSKDFNLVLYHAKKRSVHGTFHMKILKANDNCTFFFWGDIDNIKSDREKGFLTLQEAIVSATLKGDIVLGFKTMKELLQYVDWLNDSTVKDHEKE